ncbi:hypothetical protein QE436_003462 [Pantoea anthophila]|nr:hypothetical protein [Pantoea anthophila]
MIMVFFLVNKADRKGVTAHLKVLLRYFIYVLQTGF